MADQVPPSADIPYNGATTTNSGIDWDKIFPDIYKRFWGVVTGVIIILVSLFLIRLLRKYLSKLQLEHEEQKTAINLFEKIMSGFIIVVSITLALKAVEIDMTLLVSVAILGLSYGLQDIIKNYVAGILILFKAPFRIGDTIRIRDYTGKVDKMDFQSTTLRTFDRRFVTIYNSDVMTQSIVNFSNSTIRRIEIDIQVGYGSNTNSAFKVFDQILKNQKEILKSPIYKIIFKRFTDTGIEFTIRGWVQMPCNVLGIKSELALKINQAFDEQNIFMPYTKGIETDNDYTLTPDRQKSIETFKTSPDLTTEPPIDPNFIPESIDFDEID